MGETDTTGNKITAEIPPGDEEERETTNIVMVASGEGAAERMMTGNVESAAVVVA